jgi:hypothetical protein
MRDFDLLRKPPADGAKWMSVAAWQCRVIQAGENPAPVAASHGPGIEPCRHRGNGMLDA